jgi:hypothetical protein
MGREHQSPPDQGGNRCKRCACSFHIVSPVRRIGDKSRPIIAISRQMTINSASDLFRRQAG